MCDLVDTQALADEVRENVDARNQIIKDSTLDWNEVYRDLLALRRADAALDGRRLAVSGHGDARGPPRALRRRAGDDARHRSRHVSRTSPRRTRRSAACAPGLGVPPRAIGGVLGVAKAYTTRVGEGPLPTELFGEMAERLRESGQEYGASTGRPRRCGWYDAVVVRYAARINGLDALALTKLDVLDGLDEVQICTGYRIGGRDGHRVSRRSRRGGPCEPIYETMPGWKEPTRGARDFDELPARGAELRRAAGRGQRRARRDRLDGIRSRRDDHPAGLDCRDVAREVDPTQN